MTQLVAADLTTNSAPFVEQARDNGQLFIHQPYEQYSETNQDTWRRLYAELEPKWRRFAHPRFLDGLDRLALSPERIPRLEEINEFLEPLSGFQSKAVAGYVPTYRFFDCLRCREFPTTITIRAASQLSYLPEPDIFHDLAGHVPMHTDPRFSDILVRFGDVAATAADRISGVGDSGDRDRVDGDRGEVAAIESVIKAMARFFWFTVEFGLMRDPEGDGVCVYGSGLLSSAEEIESSITDPKVQRFPFQLEWVVNQGFEIDHAQPLLFVIDDFDQLFKEVGRLDTWVAEGRLDHVAPGRPEVNEDDLRSFCQAG